MEDLTLTGVQLESLSSPLRVDLFEAIRERRRASVRELAADLRKSTHSLYYHLRALTDVGLIRVAELRRVGKRDEAVYEAVAERLVIDNSNVDPAYNESLIKTVRLALRKAEREYTRSRRESVPHEEFAVLRLQAGLSSQDAAELRRRVKSLGKWVRSRNCSDATGRRISVTCVVAPLSEPEAD